jgi:hypothetical protein
MNMALDATYQATEGDEVADRKYRWNNTTEQPEIEDALFKVLYASLSFYT